MTRRKSKNGQRSTTIRAYNEGRNVGYAKMTDNDTFLDSLEVRPDARGGGLGHALMGQVIDRFGDRSIRLKASPFGKDGPDAEQLQKFYGKHGFEPEAEGGYMVRRPKGKN